MENRHVNDGRSRKEPDRDEGFNDLLNFLVCNRSLDGLQAWEMQELQGEVYEQIRHKLIRLFRWRGAEDPEDLVDRTFDRVSQRLPDQNSFVGDPSHYVCGVARLIFLESLRHRKLPEIPPDLENEPEDEKALSCLDDCLKTIRPVERELILEYYQGEKSVKIDHREVLAKQLGTSVNALRIQTCRIRTRLRKCVTSCLEQK
jgi:DNA-directed RNA polymerase specialized sigma24 family protein